MRSYTIRMEPRISHIARVQIARPLTKVLSLLPLAQRVHPPEIEVIHQLRVNCRRTEAAIRTFRPLLNPRSASRSLSELQRLRRAVSTTRDWDVFIEFLQDRRRRMTVLERPGIHYLLGFALASREAEEQKMRDGLRPIKTDRITDVEAFLGDPDQDARDFAREQILMVLARVREAFSQENPTPSQLHDVRKKMKRLRYSLEMFEGISDLGLYKATKKEIARMQEFLGQYNDGVFFEPAITQIVKLLRASDKGTWRQVSVGANALIAECRMEMSGAFHSVMEARSAWINGEFDERLESVFRT